MNNLKNYSVLILAAGMGRRLKTKGKKIPKCLNFISDKTILGRLIELLIIKGAKEINLIVGYKKKLILDFLRKNIKDIKVNILETKKYATHGHARSWYIFEKNWKKNKKPLFLFHADIVFDIRYLTNILNSKKKNIIGIVKKKDDEYNDLSLVVQTRKDQTIKTIDYKKSILKNISGEILGINKFSVKTTKNIFNHMKKFLKGKNNALSWEFVLDDFLKKNDDKIYILKDQNFFWVNINRLKDLNFVRINHNRLKIND